MSMFQDVCLLAYLFVRMSEAKLGEEVQKSENFLFSSLPLPIRIMSHSRRARQLRILNVENICYNSGFCGYKSVIPRKEKIF